MINTGALATCSMVSGPKSMCIHNIITNLDIHHADKQQISWFFEVS